jgi:hypothetical protein
VWGRFTKMRRLTIFLFSLILLLQWVDQLKAQASGRTSVFLDSQMETSSMASTYVPIESWVYSAIERLAAAGYVQTAFAGLRPWTRMDFARLVTEAQEQREDHVGEGVDPNVDLLLRDLSREFARELRSQEEARNREAGFETIDFRSTGIHGEPLTDGFHSAQTIVNDYGRPYGQGENTYTGFSWRAAYGSLAAYVDAELQQSALAPQPPASSDAAIAAADFTSEAALGPHTGFTRGRVLDAYISWTMHDNQLTFGRQSLWWGPGKGSAMLMSNNADPLTMLRYDRVRPFEIPGPGRLLGPIRVQLFAGRLSGQQFTNPRGQILGQSGVPYKDQPFIHGQKVAIKPTPNIELSVSRTTIFAGLGTPLTTHTVLRSLFSTSTNNDGLDPGDRRVAFDAQYRIPGLRNWLTGYVDTFTDDKLFPLAYPKSTAWSPGVYLAHVPHLSKMDLRFEGYLTPRRVFFPGFYYDNVHYLSGYTNNRQLMGSWIGRESNGFQAWSTWRFSSRSSIQASVRHSTESAQFLRGGNLLDVRFAADIALRQDWQLHAVAQEERWRFPLLSTENNPVHNQTFTIQLSYRPGVKSF